MGRVPALRAESIFYWIRQEKRKRRDALAKLESKTTQPTLTGRPHPTLHILQKSLLKTYSNRANGPPGVQPGHVFILKIGLLMTTIPTLQRTSSNNTADATPTHTLNDR